MITKTKLADLQQAALNATGSARKIAEAAEAEPNAWSEKTRGDYDAEMVKARDLLEQIKVAKNDLAVLDEAKSIAAEIGPMAVEDIDAQGQRPIRERVKSLGLQVIESPSFKAAMAPYKDGHVPD